MGEKRTEVPRDPTVALQVMARTSALTDRSHHRVLSRGIFVKVVIQKQVETRKLLEGYYNNPDNDGGLDQEQWDV